MWRRLVEKVSSRLMFLATLFCALLVVAIAIGLFLKSIPILGERPLWDLLGSSDWNPERGRYGLFGSIMGTLWVTGIAMAISVPLSLLTATYLSEYAHKRIKDIVRPLIDLLACIPSVVFGLWAFLVLVSFIRDYVAPVFGVSTSGFTVLTAGIILAVMVFPIVISVSGEVLQSVPLAARETSLALGATKWETTRHVVLRSASPGIVAAIVLGFSRAFGETMAVLMVVGNKEIVPVSVFDPASPLPSLIAKEYGEMMSIPLSESALLFAALALLVIVLAFNLVARLVLRRLKRGWSIE